MSTQEEGYLALFLAGLFAILRAARARITLAEAAEALVAIVSWTFSNRRLPVVAEVTPGAVNPRLVSVKVDVPKELMEAGEALVSLLDDIAGGKSPQEAAVENFGAIQRAAEGSSGIDNEVADYPTESLTALAVILGRVGEAIVKYRKAQAAKLLAKPDAPK